MDTYRKWPAMGRCTKTLLPSSGLHKLHFFQAGFAMTPTPYKTRNPGIPESACRSPKNTILRPPEDVSQKSIKWSENTRKLHLNAPNQHFSHYLIDFRCHFLGDAQWHFSDFEVHLLEFQDFGLCMAPGRVQGWVFCWVLILQPV